MFLNVPTFSGCVLLLIQSIEMVSGNIMYQPPLKAEGRIPYEPILWPSAATRKRTNRRTQTHRLNNKPTPLDPTLSGYDKDAFFGEPWPYYGKINYLRRRQMDDREVKNYVAPVALYARIVNLHPARDIQKRVVSNPEKHIPEQHFQQKQMSGNCKECLEGFSKQMSEQQEKEDQMMEENFKSRQKTFEEMIQGVDASSRGPLDDQDEDDTHGAMTDDYDAVLRANRAGDDDDYENANFALTDKEPINHPEMKLEKGSNIDLTVPSIMTGLYDKSDRADRLEHHRMKMKLKMQQAVKEAIEEADSDLKSAQLSSDAQKQIMKKSMKGNKAEIMR